MEDKQVAVESKKLDLLKQVVTSTRKQVVTDHHGEATWCEECQEYIPLTSEEPTTYTRENSNGHF